MSQENVEIVRRGIEAVNREDLEALLDLCDPQIEWWDRADDPGGDVHRGHEGVAGFLTNLFEAVQWQIEIEDCIDARDFVVVAVRLVGRGRASGASFDERQANTYRVRDGRVTEIREYREMSEALEAVGLSAQDAHGEP
jgi:ketosteroid isomerase-like protein